MSLPTTLLLGFIAGVTIVLGLPIGRMRTPAPRLRVLLNATAVGVLLFLFWDVCAAAWEPLDARLTAVHDSDASIAPVLGYGALFTGGIAAGLLGLVAYDRFMARAKAASSPQRVLQVPVAAGAVPTAFGGPENANVLDSEWFAARRLALLIAVGIGLHNFAEGLAIGQSAAQGEIALATVLVIGFALHNATEGLRHRGATGWPGTPTELGLPARDGGHRRRAHVHRHCGRTQHHLRTPERAVPHPRGRLDRLRHRPAARGGRSRPPVRPRVLRTPAGHPGRLHHRRHRDPRRSLNLAAHEQPRPDDTPRGGRTALSTSAARHGHDPDDDRHDRPAATDASRFAHTHTHLLCLIVDDRSVTPAWRIGAHRAALHGIAAIGSRVLVGVGLLGIYPWGVW